MTLSIRQKEGKKYQQRSKESHCNSKRAGLAGLVCLHNYLPRNEIWQWAAVSSKGVFRHHFTSDLYYVSIT